MAKGKTSGVYQVKLRGSKLDNVASGPIDVQVDLDLKNKISKDIGETSTFWVKVADGKVTKYGKSEKDVK